MSPFLLHHRHRAEECGAVFASFRGHDSVLRHRSAVATCATGGHAIWWLVEARDTEDALALLPHYVAQRTKATLVREVEIP
jgi:hypothetical protein